MTGPPSMPIRPAGTVIPPGLLRRRRSPLAWVAMAVLGLGALVIAILLVLVGGPGGALLTSLLAAVSFPVLILICFWLDRYEPEPARYRLAAIGWGGVAAVGMSLVVEQLLFAVPGTTDFVDAAVTAPIVEEVGKGLFLLVIVIFRRSQVHGVLDGIIYGALVGIGFAFVEDVGYYLSSIREGALSTTFFLRGIIGPFAHPLFTSATGLGIGVALTTRSTAVRVIAPIVGLLAAVVMHGTWNGSTFWGDRGFFIVYGSIILPLLVVMLAVAIWARSREGKMLTSGLVQAAQLGWIRPEEIRWVARISDRMSARTYAKRRGGRVAARALRAWQQTMTEVAFLHLRAVAGNAPRDLNARMGELLQHATEIRPWLVIPPPPMMRPPTMQPPMMGPPTTEPPIWRPPGPPQLMPPPTGPGSFTPRGPYG
jgi:RsiW-degrading membrane proteinase PrsW (M82 family)